MILELTHRVPRADAREGGTKVDSDDGLIVVVNKLRHIDCVSGKILRLAFHILSREGLVKRGEGTSLGQRAEI